MQADQGPSENQRVDSKQNEQRLNLKSMQPLKQEISNEKFSQKPSQKPQRPRPPQSQKDRVKKKRKLLSFEDQINELQNGVEKETIKKASNAKPSERKQKKYPLGKNVDVEEELRKEFIEKTEELKQHFFEIDYSYWDGATIIKKLKRRKNQKVGDLIELCRLQLLEHFQKLAGLKASDLLFVIKDFIAPHSMRICDIEALQLKTATGQNLLNFRNVKIKDLVLQVNMDSPIRIIQKTKYEKQINNYPFSNWRTINVSGSP